MYLSSLRVENFRRLQSADLTFQPGLNVIVGENNSGKTAIIDALRSVLDDRRLDFDDLRVERATGKPVRSLSVEAFFDDLSVEDEAAFNRALVVSDKPGQYRVRLAVSASLRGDELSRTFEAGRSPNTGVFYDVMNARRVHFLQALRDPNSAVGLRPGRQSRQAELLRRVSDDAAREEMIGIATRANADLTATSAVVRTKDVVRANLELLSGAVYAQDADLSFVDPEFGRLAAQLEGRADGMPVGLNGLGFGNIYYIAAVLGDFDEEGRNPKRYRALLIEEPEAHLHPHHQILLLRYMQERAEQNGPPIQIFVTTHSPILASQAAMGGLLPLVDVRRYVSIPKAEGGGLTLEQQILTKAAPIEMEGTTEQATRVMQYLDATRSELFFARRLILVEGDAERILIPALLKRRYELQPESLGITIVSAAGLNFAVFLPFIRSDALNVPVAIVTDGDPPIRQIAGEELEPSAYVRKLKELAETDSRIEVFHSRRTFEYDLAREPQNVQPMMAAMRRVRPKKSDEFCRDVHDLSGDDFAERLYAEFFADGKTSKAEFAMEIALMLKTEPSTTFVIPQYLLDAFTYVLSDPVPDASETAPDA